MSTAEFTFSLPHLTKFFVLDILAVWFVIYQLLQIVRGTRAAHILAGILTVVIAYRLAVYLNLEALRSIIQSLVPYAAIAIIVLFQSEIRRTLARMGRRNLFGGFRRLESTDELLLALTSLSADKVGALMVLERDIGLRTFVESGVRLDAAISRDILLSIFQPNTALHDGAVIVQKDRLAAAACFLPLSINPAVSMKMGTRHRAAIGITEETDCLALVVSEETGALSVAAFGDIEQGVTIERVDERITQHFGASRNMSLPPPRANDGQAEPAQAMSRMRD